MRIYTEDRDTKTQWTLLLVTQGFTQITDPQKRWLAQHSLLGQQVQCVYYNIHGKVFNLSAFWWYIALHVVWKKSAWLKTWPVWVHKRMFSVWHNNYSIKVCGRKQKKWQANKMVIYFLSSLSLHLLIYLYTFDPLSLCCVYRWKNGEFSANICLSDEGK